MEAETPRMLTTEPEPFDDELDTLAEPEEPEDLDPAAWLARDESDVVGFVSVRGGKLKVAALTQGEMDMLRKRASRPNPKDRLNPLVDQGQQAKWIIGYALSKAQGKANTPEEIQPDQLKSKLTGDLIELSRKIMRLSGYIADDERDDDLPFGSPR